MIGINYLEYLVSLPWNVYTEDDLDLRRAGRVLSQQHAGLRQVKERILEYLAVRTLKVKREFRLMVVDEEEIARTNLEHILKKEGHQVATAASGVEALEQMAANDFDLVLTGLRMLELDGMELLEKIKSQYLSTEVIIVTG